MNNLRAGVIAGTHSGVGKTTWSLALMSFFRKKGFEVQPFKVGPDYIDTGFHSRVCYPRKSRNLDRFFLSEGYLKNCFLKNSHGADLSIVEGVMGLFDGKSPVTEDGSTAQMAKLLGIPVFLVIDGAGLARSAAALVKGYQTFDPQLDLRGVFVNRVGSHRHFELLREAIEKETGIPVLGWLPNDSQVSIPERHLGLQTAAEIGSIQVRTDQLVQLLEDKLDWERFLKLSETQAKKPVFEHVDTRLETLCRIGVAYDQAFSFYYEDNFDLLKEAGAELVFFSPLKDSQLPPDLDALYLGGGFPEIYVQALSENESMKESIRKFHKEGGILYCECGGLIYMTEQFVGLIPGRIKMTDRLQHFGYHEVETIESTFLFCRGEKLRSHEFHYSNWEVDSMDFVNPYQIGTRKDGFYDGRLLASYQHLHFGQNKKLAINLIKTACRKRGEAYAA
ncbi:MAG: cobyrinate a,c-diamide synthase [Candidatus Omnitrophica bacterium]|nr:cobyrinate a,c-diamide synthase [Candidatus Omnitrophota bacterium]